jgi:hypothetical protein
MNKKSMYIITRTQVNLTDCVCSRASPPPPPPPAASTRTMFGSAATASSRINSGRSYHRVEPVPTKIIYTRQLSRQDNVRTANHAPRIKAVRDRPAASRTKSIKVAPYYWCVHFFGPARFDSRWFLDLRGAYHSTAKTEPFLHTPNHGGDHTWNNSTTTTNHGASPALAKITPLLNETATGKMQLGS